MPTVRATGWRSLASHWPVLLGLVAAGFQIVTGVATDAVATTVAAAASCYLAAAAFSRPWVAWAGILSASVVVTVSEIAGVAWWAGLSAYAAALVLAGICRGAPARALAEQAAAMLVFGGLAVVAVTISPRLGLALAGLALASHALWDYRHLRRADVVPSSLATFCILLDVPFGLAALTLAALG
ncbi:hypothetical protein [Mumia sp. Pv 4-285]|uniref:hypothetical protein n=1 Tax=Mumia qirimensis TaxID=3234852 RepID=UPI00351DA0EC